MGHVPGIENKTKQMKSFFNKIQIKNSIIKTYTLPLREDTS